MSLFSAKFLLIKVSELPVSIRASAEKSFILIFVRDLERHCGAVAIAFDFCTS